MGLTSMIYKRWLDNGKKLRLCTYNWTSRFVRINMKLICFESTVLLVGMYNPRKIKTFKFTFDENKLNFGKEWKLPFCKVVKGEKTKPVMIVFLFIVMTCSPYVMGMTLKKVEFRR